ncbi:MAG: AMP-binding protein, partial [Nitrososphaera sp.]|nr:AMP-binding protein [Nitrososphaera sp.]
MINNLNNRNLTDVVLQRAERSPEKIGYFFLPDGEHVASSLSYGELLQKACAIAAALEERHVKGKPVILLYPPGLDYVKGFFGCLCAGGMCVPAFPPRSNRADRHSARYLAILKDARPCVVMTHSSCAGRIRELFQGEHSALRVEVIATDEIDGVDSKYVPAKGCDGEEIALLQYTSGSTANPKGVIITHANLMANLQAIQESFGHGVQSCGVIWLPPYHD